MKKSKNKNVFDRIWEVPEEVYSTQTKLTLLGFKKMLIENYKAILEYQDFFIRISIDIGIININGFNLKLNEMTADDIMIIGDIDSVDFEKTEG